MVRAQEILAIIIIIGCQLIFTFIAKRSGAERSWLQDAILQPYSTQ